MDIDFLVEEVSLFGIQCQVLALHLLGNWCGCSHLRQNRRTIVPSCYHQVMVKQKHETGPVMTLDIMPEVQRGASVSRKELA